MSCLASERRERNCKRRMEGESEWHQPSRQLQKEGMRCCDLSDDGHQGRGRGGEGKEGERGSRANDSGARKKKQTEDDGEGRSCARVSAKERQTGRQEDVMITGSKILDLSDCRRRVREREKHRHSERKKEREDQGFCRKR